MKPVFMTVSHNPPETWGDCFRCCIASILEVEAISIPHPYEFGPENEEKYSHFVAKMKEWYDAWIYFFNIQAEHLNDFLDNADGYILLGGKGAVALHMVVADHTGVVHDPNPDATHFGPRDDGTYVIGLICRGPK